jgi:hypothetical protein
MDGEAAMSIDREALRAAHAEFGFWPASTDPEHLEKIREDNRRYDAANSHDPDGQRWAKMGEAMGPR